MDYVLKRLLYANQPALYAGLILIVLTTYTSFFPLLSFAENLKPEPFVSRIDSSVLSTKEINNKITVVNRELTASSIEEYKPVSNQSVEILTLKKERVYGLRELKSLYQQQIIALNRFSSLKKEKRHIFETKENRQDVVTSQSPPFSLTVQDNFYDRLDLVIAHHKNISSSLVISKKKLESANENIDMAEKGVRSTKEKTNNENYALKMENAIINRRLAYALYDLYKIRHENISLETQIKGLEKDALQKQTDWVKKHLSYDADDLKIHLEKIQEDRDRLQERTEALLREQKSIERQWIKAQANYETAIEVDLSREEVASYLLAEREAWRETYQKVLEQTEIMQQLLNSKEKIWQRRYALLNKKMPSVDELIKWQTETEVHIDNITESIEIQQNYQTSLQTRIAILRKKISENTSIKNIAGHIKNQLQAMEKLAERKFDYLSFMQGEKEIAKRLLSEIKTEQKQYALTAKFKEFHNGIKQIWEFELWVVDNNSVTIKKIVIALIILIVGILSVKYLLRFLYRYIFPYTGMDENAVASIEKLLNYLAITLIILFAMKMVNIPLTAFTFLGGAIAIGVGFGAQNLINNFISGFIMMMERPVSIGDLIEMEGTLGKVVKIGARCTQIRTGENVHILVPNSSFLEKNITNWTITNNRIRGHITVGVAYGSPVREVRNYLLKAIEVHDRILKTPEPFVLFKDFGDNSLVFDIYFWVNVNRIMEKKIIESDVRFRVNKLLNSAGITIAFPQRDVHLDIKQPLEIIIGNSDKEPK